MQARKTYLLRAWLVFSALLFLAGVAVSAVTAWFQYQQIEKNARSEFERLSSRTEMEISARLQKAVYALRGARGLYAAADHPVTREEFRRYVLSRDMDREFPGVRGFGFIERVERSDLAAFVAAARADGAPDFAVRQLGDLHYQDLFVVRYIEPAQNNLGAQGLDVGSEALRRAGLQQAISTGADTVSGTITLVQDQKKMPGLLLYVPVFRKGAAIDLPRERRAALVGVLYMPIVMAEILQDMPDVHSGMLDFQITDAPINTSEGPLMFDADGGAGLAGRYAVRQPLQLPGRSVTLRMNSTLAFDANINRAFPWLLLGGGVLISALLALSMYQQASGRLRAEHLAQDMTQDLKNALRDNKALFSTLNLHTIVSLADPSGRIIEVNDAFCAISGYSRAELLGQDHRIVNSSTQPVTYWQDMWQTISSGKPWRDQVCNRARSGQLYWVDTLVAPVFGNGGRIDKYLCICTDITAAKKAEEELRWSQSLMDKMSNSSPLGFLVVDNRSDEILYINQRCCEIWGIGHLAGQVRRREISNAALTASCLSELADAAAYLASCLPLQSVDERITLEDEIAFTNQRTVRRFTTQIRDAQDQYYGRFYIFEDITERKEAERALTRATEAAQAASLSKSQFLANMSHEIRTPMNAILGLLNLLQRTELTASQRDYTSKTEGAAQSLLGLLNDILDFSKVEAGKMTLESEPFRIDSLLRSLSVVLSANVGTKHIDVLFDIDAALPEVVRGDAMRLQQVLTNLGGNAVKFTSEGQVSIALRMLSHTAGMVRIAFSVEDSGIGIAPEHQAHIFSGFSQAEGSTTRRFGGTGLGLAISQRMVGLMGGSIGVHSKPGQGSSFGFVLDLPTVEDAVLEPAQPAQPAMASQHVLVVDDNPLGAELGARMVRSWGWSADVARSGQVALEMVAARCDASPGAFAYPLIYIDWRLPGIDGWETTRRIRQLARERGLEQPLVIMVTGHGRDMLAQRSEGEQDLLNGFLVKPVTASMMYEAMLQARTGQPGLRQITKGRSNPRQLSGMRILVVEDNLINQQVAEELLSAAGALVSLAANGQLGVDAVAAAAPQFDAVLMDVQMPVLDGYGATRAIREELGLAQLPIIAMTANAMASDREVCLAAGMNEHIGKPFDMGRLVSLLIRMTGFAVAGPGLAQSAHADAAPPELPEVPGLELATALARMAGMRSLYLRTARDFMQILQGTMPALRENLAAGNRHMAVMALHTLKGNAATLGASALAGAAARLEALCKADGGMQACEAELGGLQTLVQSTRQMLSLAVQALDAQASPAPASPAPAPDAGAQVQAQQALRRLCALAGAEDMDALQCFAEERLALAGLPGEWVDRLELALQDLDFGAASALGEDMLRQMAA